MGETIRIPVTIEDITLEEGMVSFDTILDYDTETFEVVKVEKAQGWLTPTVIEKLISSATETLENVKGNQEVMTILLKVKEKAKTGEKTIKLTKFNISDGNKTVSNEEGTVANITIKNTKQEAIVKKAMILVMVILIFIAMLSILLVSLIRKNRKQETSVEEEIKETEHTEETKEEQTTKEKEVKYDTQENMRKAIEGKDAKLEAIIIGEDGKEIEIRKERRKQERRKPERRQPDRRQEERRKTQTEEE